MSQANDILDNLTEDQIAAYTSDPLTEEHIVIGNDRIARVPESLKRIGVQFDQDIETVTFDCPRYWDGHDMSLMKIYINYLRSDGEPGSFIAENVHVDGTDETIMHFDWTVSEHVTAVKGTLSFLVCIKRNNADGTKEIGWHSELNKEMYITEGLECTEAIINSYPDIVTQILMVTDRANAIAETLEEHLRNGDFELGLPMVTQNDNGKVLRVENGAWAKDEVLIFKGGVSADTNNSVFIRYSANPDGTDFTETCQKGQYYIGVATALAAPVYASSYTWVRMVAPLEQNEYGNAFTGDVSGKTIRVDDVSRIPHTVTAKVKSKNLLSYPYSNASMNSNGVTITDNGDGSITVNGTATANVEFMFRNMVKVQPGTYKYTLFGTEDITGLSGNVQKRTTGGSWVANLSNTKTHNGIFTLTDDDVGHLYSFNLYIISGTILNNVIIKPQLEPGETATPYTPYVDPSTVTVTKCGKNLWSYRPNLVQNGVTITTNENGKITYNGTCNGSFVIYKTIRLPAGIYTLSDRASHFVTDSADARTQVYIPSIIDARIDWSHSLNRAVTFTLTEPSTDVRLRIKGANGAVYNNFSIMPLLEVGSKMTAHEPYKDETTHTPNADGTIVDILSVDPTMTLYTDSEGALVDLHYNRDSNVILDYIDKNVITATATLKDNGAYTLTFEKGVKL